jgi:hypothetical protein
MAPFFRVPSEHKYSTNHSTKFLGNSDGLRTVLWTSLLLTVRRPYCKRSYISINLLRYKAEPRFTNLISSWKAFFTRNVRKPKLIWSHGVLFNNIFKRPQNTTKFKRRHGEFEQGCVLSETYTATDALPPILPACRQPLLPACVFVTRDTVRHARPFFFGKFVRDERRSWTEVPLYMQYARGYWWELARYQTVIMSKTI